MLRKHIHKIWSNCARFEHFFAFISNIQIISYWTFQSLYLQAMILFWYYFLGLYVLSHSECLMKSDFITSVEHCKIIISKIHNLTCLYYKNTIILFFWNFEYLWVNHILSSFLYSKAKWGMRNLKANNIQIIWLKMIAALVRQKRGNHRSIASLNHLNSKVCNFIDFLNPNGCYFTLLLRRCRRSEVAVKAWGLWNLCCWNTGYICIRFTYFIIFFHK